MLVYTYLQTHMVKIATKEYVSKPKKVHSSFEKKSLLSVFHLNLKDMSYAWLDRILMRFSL